MIVMSMASVMRLIRSTTFLSAAQPWDAKGANYKNTILLQTSSDHLDLSNLGKGKTGAVRGCLKIDENR